MNTHTTELIANVDQNIVSLHEVQHSTEWNHQRPHFLCLGGQIYESKCQKTGLKGDILANIKIPTWTSNIKGYIKQDYQ